MKKWGGQREVPTVYMRLQVYRWSATDDLQLATAFARNSNAIPRPTLLADPLHVPALPQLPAGLVGHLPYSAVDS